MTQDSDLPRRVLFKVPRATMAIASARYRALLPAVALSGSHKLRCLVYDDPKQIKLKNNDVLVIVKSLSPGDSALAARARAAGALVIIDLCDNVFVPGYKTKSPYSVTTTFYQLASLADTIVTSSEPLAKAVRDQIGDLAPITVIPDGLETPQSLRQQQDLLRRSEVSLKRRLLEWFRAKRSAPPGQAKSLQASTDRSSILWYGNHGAPYGQFGLSDIALFADALNKVAAKHPIELLVVSNNEQHYQQVCKDLDLPSRYLPWSGDTVTAALNIASAVIVPNSLDSFSICKTANRTTLALQHQIPVVATMTPALRALQDVIWCKDPYDDLVQILDDPAAARERAGAGARLCESLFGGKTIGRLWLAGIKQARDRVNNKQGQIQVGLVLDLAQDWDVATGIASALIERGAQPIAIVSAAVASGKDDRTLRAIVNKGLGVRLLNAKSPVDDVIAALFGMKAIISFAETSLKPHRFANRLAKLAAGQRIVSCTVQHGYENVALTYSDDVHPIEEIEIRSDRIYTWSPVDQLHGNCRPDIKQRCIPVGCPKPAHPEFLGRTPIDDETRPVIGVFENLHWHRYDDNYREAFLAALDQACQDHPSVLFLLKPHHAGRWLTDRYKGPQPVRDNLLIADPLDEKWAMFTAPQLFSALSAVVTTPSTVALDAARYGLPVAVTGFGLDLPQYRPLTIIQDRQGLSQFTNDAIAVETTDQQSRQSSQQFVDRVLVQGNAADAIVDDLAADIGLPQQEKTS